ncbi:MAG: DUF3108 domain-containing protein [Niabella sp.]
MRVFRLSILPLFALMPFDSNTLLGTKNIVPETVINSSCAITNTAFKEGEKVSFMVYYTVGGLINAKAGTGSFTTSLEKLNGRNVYHVVAEGKTLSSYEWAYKARDVYETYMDTETLQPLKFIRDVSEGGYKKYQNVFFNKSANTAIGNEGVFKVPACVQDVVSSVFYARNIDFNRLKTNSRIMFSMFLDNEVYQMSVKYLGRETVTTSYGRFKAIKIRPVTIKGNIFEGDEKMTVWVTDDANHVPIRVESPIVVGKVRIDMTSFQGLRSPMTSLVKKY